MVRWLARAARATVVDVSDANDESFIGFGSMHPGSDAHERRYISFRDARGWSTQNIWSVSLVPWLDRKHS